MKYFTNLIVLLIAIAASLFIGSSYYYYSPLFKSVTEATAVVYPTKGNKVSGVVNFAQQKDGIRITAQLSGLTPGNHGFHIHEFGDCACDDAVCAGDHFNPTNQPHGGPNSEQRHIGDFGNIYADENGNAHYDRVDAGATLNGPHSIVGRAVIVHVQEDDLKSQPTGNAGARIGCGVVGVKKN
ncbi:MAG: superoxide dismutase family protein [Candidatus Babeliales bacterium]